MEIPDKAYFQPKNETLAKWLSTRKPEIIVGRIPFPRYFSDSGNSVDQNWFTVALVGELLGLFTTIYGGARAGGIFLLFATLTIIMFIFLDFFFAVKLHRNKSKECKIKSYSLLVDSSKADEFAKIRIELDKGKFADFLYSLGIIIIALIKVAGIFIMGVFSKFIIYIPFALIYLIVAYVHLRHTGYFFAYYSCRKAISKDYKSFANGSCKATEKRETFTTVTPLTDLPIKHVPHQIVQGDKNLEYKLSVVGVLTDEDIQALVAGQSDENKRTVFLACRKLQLENY